MSRASVLRKFRAAAGRFIGASEGNIAVIFALSVVPIISFVGAAIDHTRVIAARSSMQAALDSTALMLSKDLSSRTINSTQISTKATAYFTRTRKASRSPRPTPRRATRRRRPSSSTVPVPS